MKPTFARKLLGPAAATVGALGLLTVTPTTHAAPPCTDWVFNGNTTVLEVPPSWTIAFSSDTKEVPGTVIFTKPPGSDAGDGPASGGGGISGSGINMMLNGIQFNGNIDANGNASGFTIFKNPGTNDPHWKLAAPLKCNTPAPVAPKDAVRMDIFKDVLTATVHVNNTADIGGKCNYDAKGTSGPFAPPLHRDFNIGPNQSTSFDVPAPPLGSGYHVTLSCSGDFQGQQVEFGHVDQDVTSF